MHYTNPQFTYLLTHLRVSLTDRYFRQSRCARCSRQSGTFLRAILPAARPTTSCVQGRPSSQSLRWLPLPSGRHAGRSAQGQSEIWWRVADRRGCQVLSSGVGGDTVRALSAPSTWTTHRAQEEDAWRQWTPDTTHRLRVGGHGRRRGFLRRHAVQQPLYGYGLRRQVRWLWRHVGWYSIWRWRWWWRWWSMWRMWWMWWWWWLCKLS